MPKDLQKTYNLFLSNLDGKMAVITTPFVKLDCFYVKFDILQLPHLLGLHKIYKDSPRIIYQKLNDEVITYKHLQRHSNFGTIKDRVELFEFILEIFLEGYNDSVIYVSEADKFGSSMKLDIAFSHPHKNKILTLGLREVNDCVYAPVTFYVSKSSRPTFTKSKRAKILTLELISFNL